MADEYTYDMLIYFIARFSCNMTNVNLINSINNIIIYIAYFSYNTDEHLCYNI